jgi:hypothetical protein
MQENFDNNNYPNHFEFDNFKAKPYFRINQLHIAFSIIGTMIWVFGYALFSFYKDYLITFLRKEEKFGRGFYYKYVKYQSYKKLIFGFNIFYVFFVSTFFLLINMRYFCILSGMIIFFIGYIGFCIKVYLMDQKKFDLFDEFVWVYQNFIKEKLKNLLTVNVSNEGAKAKTE